jgi:uncharacterized protein DUF955
MTASRRSRQQIKDEVRRVLLRLYENRKNQLGDVPSAANFYPVQPELVVKELQWEIDEVAQIGFTGYCKSVKASCVHSKRKISVAIDAIANLGQRHFTIAHEIGHVVLHKPPLMFTDLNSAERPSLLIGPDEHGFRMREREADIFAAELLMPEKAVRWRFQEMFGRASLSPRSAGTRSGDAQQCALDLATREASKDGSRGKSLMDFFSVSRAAMAARLIELDLVHA